MNSFYDYLKTEMSKQGTVKVATGYSATAMDCQGCRPSSLGSETPYKMMAAMRRMFSEADHPRKSKGGKGGGQFAKKPETLAREDERDVLSKGQRTPEEEYIGLLLERLIPALVPLVRRGLAEREPRRSNGGRKPTITRMDDDVSVYCKMSEEQELVDCKARDFEVGGSCTSRC